MEALAWRTRRLEGSERALLIFPRGRAKGLPVVYLLHGQGDDEEDWMSEKKGMLATILSKSCSEPMLIVLPFGGMHGNAEPPLQEFRRRLRRIMKSVATQFAPDTSRQAILGISMGGKQALAFVTAEPARGGFSVLGILSGKLQGANLHEVRRHAKHWPKSLGKELVLYYHYCGAGDDAPPRWAKKALTGDKKFLAGNEAVANQLAGGQIRITKNGLHNWKFWRPQLKKFFERLANLWRDRAVQLTASRRPAARSRGRRLNRKR